MNGTLLILPGGAEAGHVARRAKELGLYVVVADGNPEAPGFAHSDSRLIANACSGDETGAAAERFSRKVRRIDGLLSVSSASAAALAAVSTRLRLPGLSRRSGQLLTDRLALNQRLGEAGVPVPWFAEVATPQELARLAVERGADLLLFAAESAPADAQRLSSGKNLNEAFARVQSAFPDGRFMVQQHLTGQRFWSASLVVEDRCFTVALGDCVQDEEPAFAVAKGIDLPASVAPDLRARIAEVIARSASALGIAEGPVECVIALDQNEPYVVDIAYRLPGAPMAMRGIEISTGVDYAAAAIRLALGERIAPAQLEPARAVPVAQRTLVAQPGQTSSGKVEDAARSIPGIAELEIDTHHGATALASGGSRGAAAKSAEQALATIRIETEEAD